MQLVSAVVVLLLTFVPCSARQVTVTLWISGGAEGILDGGRIAPGSLGLLSTLGERSEQEPWIDVGGTRHTPLLDSISSFRGPEAVVPGESLLRVTGQQFLYESPGHWVITNAGILPQFPDTKLPTKHTWEWTHADGGQVRLLSAWSDGLPLTVPADKLRPLQVLPAVETIRTSYLQPSSALQVLVMPEGTSGPEWSQMFPDADVVVEPPGGRSQVIEVADGERIRIRPGMHGRSVIRVWARWDTVTKTFAPPKAEVVWVSPCEYNEISLPEELAEQIRTFPEHELPPKTEMIWDPIFRSMKTPSTRPDAVRAQLVPQDEAWFLATVPASRWAEWKHVEGSGWRAVSASQTRSPRVALPAHVVAGRGKVDCPIRKDIHHGSVQGEWLSLTTRDLISRLETTTP